MIFAVFNSQYDEEFIAHGENVKDAFENLQGMWAEASLESTKFYQTTSINPIEPAKIRKEFR